MKIVTYNIHRGADKKNNPTLNEIGYYLKNLDCDVICLQEVLYNQFKKIKSILKIDGVFVANVKQPGILYGICIFSKYEIKDSAHLFLTSKKEQRGLLSIEINNNSESISIINTHLGLDKLERYNQLNEILDYCNRIGSKSIICGDFNEKNVNITNFIDMAVECDKYKIDTFESLKARIDYIFVDKNINMEKYDYHVDKTNLSDHYPVIVEIKEEK
ncbi:MAG: endonuclease/exonuclease/phosphatase family protein [Peptostreptococcaceae bacterium]